MSVFNRTMELHDSLHDAKCNSDECLQYIANVVTCQNNFEDTVTVALKDLADHTTFLEKVTSSSAIPGPAEIYSSG